MRFTFSRLLISLAFAAMALNANAGSKGIAYVSNQDGGVGTIDLETMQPTGTIDIQAKGPRGIGITPDGKLLVTANKDGDNISVIDVASGTVVKQIPIGKNPEFVRVHDYTAYVTYEPSPTTGGAQKPEAAGKDDDDDKLPGHIAIVDLKTSKVIKDIIGKPETEGLEFSPDGKKLIVTNESDNSITVHDMKSGKLLETISVAKFGQRPRGIKVSPDGKMYIVTLEFSNKFLVLDSKLKPIKAIDTGKSPYGVAFDRAGNYIYIASSKEKALQIYDAKTFAKVKDVPTGERCWHFSFSPDDKNILLACGRSNELVVVDTDKQEVTKRIADKDMPWGIVTYPKSMGSLDKP
ncbi:MAG TPA: beta-propeller fold lactonase family protein [Methylophilaceae bacterium]|jgi:YVTN family beta-propeller protein